MSPEVRIRTGLGVNLSVSLGVRLDIFYINSDSKTSQAFSAIISQSWNSEKSRGTQCHGVFHCHVSAHISRVLSDLWIAV